MSHTTFRTRHDTTARVPEETPEGTRHEFCGPLVTTTGVHCEETTPVITYHTDGFSTPPADWRGTWWDGDCVYDNETIHQS